MRVLLLDGLKETFSYVTRFLIFFYFERHGTSEFTVEPEDRKKTKERKELEKVKLTRKEQILPQPGSLATLITLNRLEKQGYNLG